MGLRESVGIPVRGFASETNKALDMLLYRGMISLSIFFYNYFFEKGSDSRYVFVCQTLINIGWNVGGHPDKSGFTAVLPK